MYRDILFALAKMNSLHLPNAAKALLRIANTDVRSPAERHVAMSWAERLKRVFNIDIDIDIEVCDRCGGSVKVIACIEDQDVIDSILVHLREKEQGSATPSGPTAAYPGQPAVAKAVTAGTGAAQSTSSAVRLSFSARIKVCGQPAAP